MDTVMNDVMIHNSDRYDILIVDDAPESLELLGRMLKERGYRVRPSPNGRFALASVAARLPDLILLDVKMPEMDGFEVCRRLKSKEHSRKVPVIFISAHGETANKVKGFENGGVDYIAKPFEREEVLARVGLHLRLHELTERLEQKVDQRTKQLREEEEEVRRLQNYLFNIINSMPSILIAVDNQGQVTQWNRMAEKSTGIAAESAYGNKLLALMPSLAANLADLADWTKANEALKLRNTAHTLPEGTRYEDITIYPLIADGEHGAVIRIDDVTDKVRLEEIMIQNEKMLSVGGLAAGMAHEINNPLAGIKQTAEVIQSRLHDNLALPASVREAEKLGITIEAIEAFMRARHIPRMLDTIKECSVRVTELVDNMLSFARKSDRTISTYRLEDIIEKTLKLAATDYNLKKRFDFKRIEIRKEFARAVPAVPCEVSTIQQVLLNVLSNGAQAMQSAGTASPCFIIRLYPEEARQMVCIEIEDNGPGMDEATRKRVFEPFFTTKPVGTGTGLGLSVSYFIIFEQHRGEMKVISSPGSGARFIISLPVTREPSFDREQGAIRLPASAEDDAKIDRRRFRAGSGP
jgi:PAS domain S-box-containing protein